MCIATISVAHQPMRSADLMGYLYILAICQAEYNFPACLAYDIAFRKKAARFRLTSWGQIDPQLYTKAFTGAGKAKAQAWCDHCLAPSHTPAECPYFYPGGSAKQSRVATAGPKQFSQTPSPPRPSAEISTEAHALGATAPAPTYASPPAAWDTTHLRHAPNAESPHRVSPRKP